MATLARHLTLALWLCLLPWVVAAQGADVRVALVIGNSSYAAATRLPNPSNDAKAIAAKLTSIGFDVMLREDMDGQSFRVALGEFSEKAQNADIAVFFYAGHGIEFNGENYLIPVDAQMRSEATAQFETVGLQQVVGAVNASRKLGVVLLDACRDNPFATSMARRNGTRSTARGLAPISLDGESGILVSFAAQPGNTADDGDGEHSPYTTALLEVIDEPGLEVGRMFRAVRARVREQTGGRQVPMEHTELPDEDIYFVASNAPPPQPVQPAPAPVVAPVPAPQATRPQVEDPLLVYLTAVQARDRAALEDFIRRYPDHIRAADARAMVENMVEQDFWATVLASDDLNSYRSYLLAFPNGNHRIAAEARIAALAPVLQPTPVPTPTPQPVPVPPPTAPPSFRGNDLGNCPLQNGSGSVTGIAYDDTLFVRSGPGTNFPQLGELAFNANGISIASCANRWCVVEYGCLRGYASQKYLKQGHGGQGGSAFAGIYRVVNHPMDQKLNVRGGPSTRFPILAELPPNATGIEVTDCQAKEGDTYRWCNLSWNNVSGWAYGRYLMNAAGLQPYSAGFR